MADRDERTKYRTLSQNLSPQTNPKSRNHSTGASSKNPKKLQTKSPKGIQIFQQTKPSKKSLNPDLESPNEAKILKKETDLESIQETKNLKAYYRSRYASLIESIQETNKQKLIQKEQEELKLKKKKEKLKDELGLSNIKSKFSNVLQEEENSFRESKEEKNLHKIKTLQVDNENNKNPEEIKVKKEATEKIVKRAQDYLQRLSEKRAEEQKREEENQARELKLRIALKESILGKISHDDPDLQRKKSDKILSHPKKISITDINLYKKRYKLKDSDKIFIIVGCYPDIRKALKLREGWHENLDINSPCFDLKWTVRRKDINFDGLEDYQLCNHFDKSTMITTKVGLSHSLRNLIWFNSVDIDTFYPRCFDLVDNSEREDFYTEFKAMRAESILKQALNGASITKKVLQTALKVCRNRLRDLDDLIDDPNIKNWELVTEKDWSILNGCITGTEDISKLLPEINETLNRLSQKFPQFGINGMNNIWILKPAGLSRGRGIECYNLLDEIKEKLQREGQWVIQKYIENPLIILKKKFDIRQWVLVTSWNPLTAWFYDKCYLRFGVEDYSIDDLKNKFIHLTNNSIQKNSEKFESTEIEGNMWHSDDLSEYLKNKEGYDIWEENIKPRIKKIVIHSLECVQDMVDGRKGSCELYGYDIMLDDLYNPWLIEVNCSPAMDYSTVITEVMVKEVMMDTIKIMVDYFYAPAKDKNSVDTGGFTLLIKSDKTVDRPIQSFGITLLCQGKAIK